MIILKFFFFNINKKLIFGSYSKGGRNFSGKICSYHKHGGLKSQNIIDYWRRLNLKGHILKIFKRPLRSAWIGFIFYTNGFCSNIILSEGISLGDSIYSGIQEKAQILHIGSTNKLENISLFSIISNIELIPFGGSIVARSAGVGATIIGLKNNKVTLKLTSGWFLNISKDCLASLGYTSNVLHRLNSKNKAGNMYKYFSKRPIVRGVAMNPCDHPHGGGEGKKSPLRAPKSKWGWLTKGTPTLKKKQNILCRKLFKNIR